LAKPLGTKCLALDRVYNVLGEEIIMIIKCEAQGDVMYFNANDIDAARVRFIEVCGDQVPEELLTWTEDVSLPDGEEAL